MRSSKAQVLGVFCPMVALTVSLVTSSSSAIAATQTWTVSPGGPVSITGKSFRFTDPKTGTVNTCSMKADGSLKHGSGLSGTKIGSIKTAHFNKCFLLGITYTASHTPWDLNAKSYDASTHVTHGTISGIDLSFSGAGCVGQIDGTAAAADDGVLPVAYTNSTGKLAIGRGAICTTTRSAAASAYSRAATPSPSLARRP